MPEKKDFFCLNTPRLANVFSQVAQNGDFSTAEERAIIQAEKLTMIRLAEPKLDNPTFDEDVLPVLNARYQNPNSSDDESDDEFDFSCNVSLTDESTMDAMTRIQRDYEVHSTSDHREFKNRLEGQSIHSHPLDVSDAISAKQRKVLKARSSIASLHTKSTASTMAAPKIQLKALEKPTLTEDRKIRHLRYARPKECF